MWLPTVAAYPIIVRLLRLLKTIATIRRHFHLLLEAEDDAALRSTLKQQQQQEQTITASTTNQHHHLLLRLLLPLSAVSRTDSKTVSPGGA